MSEARVSSTSPSAPNAASEITGIGARNTSARADFLTKLLLSIFLGIAFLAAATALGVWYFKTRATKRAEAIEMQKMEEAARSSEAEGARIQEHRASTLATLEGRNGERVRTSRSSVR